MPTDNKKAPKVRSGDEINPVLGSIIKIGGLIVIAALAVVITFILIDVFKKDKTESSVYKDSYHLSFDDFLILTNPSFNDRQYVDIDNEEIRDVMIDLYDKGEEGDYYIYFYYNSLIDELPEDEVQALANMDQSYPLFFVNLESRVTSKNEEVELEKFADVFTSTFWSETFIITKDDLVIYNKETTQSFIISLNINDNRDENSGPVESYYGVEISDVLLNLPQKDSIEE